jgi:hypothetical protein
LVLSDDEQAALEGWVRRRSTAYAWASLRNGASNKDVGAELGSTRHAVGHWRARFVEHGVSGLGDMLHGHDAAVTDDPDVVVDALNTAVQ